MKKLNFLFLILGLIVLSCNKTPDAPSEQEVVFTATQSSSGFKVSTCDNPSANFALIKIDGYTYQVDVFYLNNQIYTNTLKLAPGEHTIEMFVLVNDGGTPDTPDGDEIVLASPLEGNTYANFVSMPLPFNFTVDAFLKTDIPIEVLCFDVADYDKFGFTWFSVEEIIVREICFFGDFCVNNYTDYAGSLYEYQRNGLQHDMPAIFKIDVVRNGDTLISYSNEEWYGEGRPLCVQYPDYSNFTDNYEFILSVLVKDGDSVVYKPFYTWAISDDESLPNIGDDNVMDFVLGDCVPDADLVLPPYEEPVTTSCETAFAYDAAKATCFIDDGFGNWGWVNGKYYNGDYTLDLIAAAGGCDISNGYHVGTVSLSYHYGTVKVTYNLNEGYTMDAAQLYVGYDKYPTVTNDPTVAPGQYTVVADELAAGTQSYTFTLSGYYYRIYIIAHADVCGSFN